MENNDTTSMPELLTALREKVAERQLSNSEIARLSGRSPSTISQVLNNKYRGREDVVREILDALEKDIPATSEAESGTKPWLSSGEELIEGILNLTYYNRGFSAIVGPSGLGKTFTAQYFAEGRPDVAYTRCNDGMSMGDTVQLVLDITGNKGYGTKTQKMKTAIRSLRERKIRMILVDEADLLVTERGNKPAILKKISVFREVKEAGIGVAMIGLESFDDTLREVGETYVTSRIDYFRRVTTPRSEELAYYLAGQGWDPGLPESKRAISMAPSSGLFRFLEKLTQAATFVGSLTEALNMIYAPGGRYKEVREQ